MKFETKCLYLVANFDRFLWNNNAFMEENHTFKNHQPRKKLLFWQLITIFFDFQQNNSIFVEKKNEEGEFYNMNQEENLCFNSLCSCQVFLISGKISQFLYFLLVSDQKMKSSRLLDFPFFNFILFQKSVKNEKKMPFQNYMKNPRFNQWNAM